MKSSPPRNSYLHARKKLPSSMKLSLKFCRKAYRKLCNPANRLPIDLSGQAASDLIKAALVAEKPSMISRFGSVELSAILTALAIHDKGGFVCKSLKAVFGEGQYFWWDKSVISSMYNNAGFFPSNPITLSEFAEKMLTDSSIIDILGSWTLGEKLVMDHNPKAKIIKLIDMDPYFHDNPWTEALRGKKVLVIHPFEISIRNQYKKRHLLFTDPRILPVFDLLTLKAVQTIAGEKTNFSNWFEALDSMCEAISQKDFDIAIIGAGAYGMPLSAYVKRMGKKAIHLGGATQLLFGIKGKRWDERGLYQSLYNEHWTRPLPEETPQNARIVESSCYW